MPVDAPVQKTLTLEVVKAEYNLELNKLNYQEILQRAEDISFNKETLEKDYAPLKDLRAIIKKIDDLREEKKKPHLEAGRLVDAAAKDLSKPLQEVLDRKTKEYSKLAEEVRQEQEKVAREQDRVNGIRSAIDTFFLDASQAIAAAKTPQDIVAVEKLIGSHKANSSRYAEFLPELIEKAAALTPKIKDQKEAIRQLDELHRKEEEAKKTGDDATLLQVMEEKEVVQATIDEGKVTVQEEAINQATNTPVYVGRSSFSAPKPRRTTWKIEIVDLELAIRKSRMLLDITLNPTKANESKKLLQDSGVFDGKTEHIVNGIRYYEDKQY